MRDNDTKILEEKYTTLCNEDFNNYNVYQVDIDKTSVPGVTIKFVSEGIDPNKIITDELKKDFINITKQAKKVARKLHSITFNRYSDKRSDRIFISNVGIMGRGTSVKIADLNMNKLDPRFFLNNVPLLIQIIKDDINDLAEQDKLEYKGILAQYKSKDEHKKKTGGWGITTPNLF